MSGDTVWATSVHRRMRNAHSGTLDRLCSTLEVGKAVCEDYLGCLSFPRDIVEDWQDLSMDGAGLLWVRYFNDERDPGKEPRICEQRVEARRVDTSGRWFADE